MIFIETKILGTNPIADYRIGTLKSMGDYKRFTAWQNLIKPKCNIIKLNKDEYIVKETGEKRQFNHNTTKAENIKSLRRQSKALGDIILTNATQDITCYHLTLTYEKEQFDVSKLSNDYKNFITRLKNICGKFENICVVEPCATGSWHLHSIIFFADPHTTLSKEQVQECWLKGYSCTRYVDNPRGLAKYFEVAEITEDKAALIGVENLSKAQVKGLRAGFYPAGTHLYRTSRGIKRPTKELMTYGKASSIIGDSSLVAKTELALIDESGYELNRLQREEYLKKGSC